MHRARFGVLSAAYIRSFPPLPQSGWSPAEYYASLRDLVFAGGQERSTVEAVWGTAIIFVVPFLLYFVLFTFIVVRSCAFNACAQSMQDPARQSMPHV